MEKKNKTLVYGAVGFCGGMTTLASVAGPCSAGACSACFRCFGMGVILVTLALFKRIRGREKKVSARNGPSALSENESSKRAGSAHFRI